MARPTPCWAWLATTPSTAALATTFFNGGGKSDALTGGADADRFQLDILSISANRDVFMDFVSGTDRIDLSVVAFASLASYGMGALSAGELIYGTAATAPGQHLIYDGATGSLYYDSDGAGGTAKVLLALLTGAPTLNPADIYIY